MTGSVLVGPQLLRAPQAEKPRMMAAKISDSFFGGVMLGLLGGVILGGLLAIAALTAVTQG